MLQPCLVADGGSQLQAGAVGQGAAPGAHHHAQARLLEDVTVVVVGVAHGPAAQVALGLLLVAAVDEAHVAIRPLTEMVEVGWFLEREGKDGGVDLASTSHGTLLICPEHVRMKTGPFSFPGCHKMQKLYCHKMSPAVLFADYPPNGIHVLVHLAFQNSHRQ